MKQYIVELTSEERYQLQQIVTKGNTIGYRIKYAHILLKADQGKDGLGWSDPKITEAFECNVSTVYRLRKRLVEDGFSTLFSLPDNIQVCIIKAVVRSLRELHKQEVSLRNCKQFLYCKSA